MEERKLTKADIDKVRHIEGFPIGKHEDIIALSRPPYYTACPNPYIEDFIRENGTPYDEATDDYHREPFAADVSEGKNDPIYNAHSYHTKVPYKAIMRYILHYTKPGDIVFDGFCGTGMTGVAAQMCGHTDNDLRYTYEHEMPTEHIEWGNRKAILSDLSPAATFISYNYNTPVDVSKFESEATRILRECNDEYGWMYQTHHLDNHGREVIGLEGTPVTGTINYVVWSDVFVCPSCTGEIVFWDNAVDQKTGKVNDRFLCPHCKSELKKKDCERATESHFDVFLHEAVTMSKQIPVLINYTASGRRYNKTLDEFDQELIAKIDAMPASGWVPVDTLPDGFNTNQPMQSHRVLHTHQFYSKRNLLILSGMYEKIKQSTMSDKLLIWFTSQLVNISKLNRHRIGVSFPYNPLSGTLYISSMIEEANVFTAYANKLQKMAKAYSMIHENETLISCQSSTDLHSIIDGSVDYIFTDPPFGGNLNYSELSFIWESWLRVKTNNKCEAIINPVQKKELPDYQALMEQCFREFYRILKPNHWITIEFHNSKNSVWNAIQEALMRCGFIVADTRTLDKQTGSFKEVVSINAVKQDLIISAYKPRESFVQEFQQRAGDPEMAWEFVRQHLRNVPVVADGNHDGKLDVIAERQDYLLFDRMVAWHIMNGIPVPMDAHTFYDGLRQRFLQRDGMFFLPDQVNEYDDKRAHMELDAQQLSFLVTDEKNAIQWLSYILSEGPKTYQEIQPAYLQELHQSKQEKMPELLDMLRENFVQDDKGAWYVPDLSNAADLAKVRRKALLKEFYDSCVPGKGKLKVFRMEAIRAGFDECWKQRDFKTIVSVGERLPEAVLQEDPALLMYYDNACSRV